MKQVNLLSLIVLAGYTLLPVFAGPLSIGHNLQLTTRDVTEESESDIPEVGDIGDIGESAEGGEINQDTSISPTAAATVKYLQDAANTAAINAKPICFYSGYTEVVNAKIKTTVKKTAHGDLKRFMTDRGCNSIDDIVNLSGQQSAATKWNTDADWRPVSEALGKAVTGNQFALLGKVVPADSVWLKDELPALKGNKAVARVEAWELKEDGTFGKIANVKG